MKRVLTFVFLLFLGNHWMLQAQELEVVKKKPRLEAGFGLEGTYRNFSKRSYLGDTYQMGLGYQLSMKLGFMGYPGIGFYSGAQGAQILDNQFLGDFFDQVRMRDSGIVVFYDIPVFKQFSLTTDVGYGLWTVVHGESGRRFLLNYQQYFGNIGFKYQLPLKNWSNRLLLKGNVGSGIFRGNQIIINSFDRKYVQQASDIRGSFGILLELN
jgi:hypothetical protein